MRFNFPPTQFSIHLEAKKKVSVQRRQQKYINLSRRLCTNYSLRELALNNISILSLDTSKSRSLLLCYCYLMPRFLVSCFLMFSVNDSINEFTLIAIPKCVYIVLIYFSVMFSFFHLACYRISICAENCFRGRWHDKNNDDDEGEQFMKGENHQQHHKVIKNSLFYRNKIKALRSFIKSHQQLS